MLSAEMTAELGYFFAMLLYGCFLSLCYHGLVFVRTVIRHDTMFVDAEDILFLIFAGLGFFLVAYEKNYGILRWYAFAGAALGCLLYMRTICVPLEAVRKWILQKCKKTYTIKKKKRTTVKFSGKGRVSADESSGPQHEEKRKKKNRT